MMDQPRPAVLSRALRPRRPAMQVPLLPATGLPGFVPVPRGVVP